MQIIEMAKSHPVPFAVGGIIILLVLVSSRSSSGSSSAAGYSTAAMANSTALAQINAATSVSLGAQATERYSAGEQAALQRTGIMANLFNSMTTTSANTSVAMSGVSAQLVKNTQDANNARALMEINGANARAVTNASAAIASKQMDNQLAINANDNNFKLAQIGAQTQGAVTLLGMNLDFQGKYLPTVLQSAENMATINGKSAAEIARIQTQAANTTAQAGKNKTDWGIVTDVGKIVASLFAM
jgi:hypothetical protein